jgi:DNA-binding NarL/FixJ family response regulator
MPSSTTSSDVRVLLVDDNDAMLARMAAVLGPECVVVGTAHDGDAGLRAAEALHPDVIVLDISMPGMSGLEVASRLRAAGSRAAIVFFTVHGETAIAREALAAGGLGYVVKPRLHADLLRAVREAKEGRPFTSPL